ncbi:MAG: tautomerase family protein [Syntrophales bacterium]|nr:tautomerase family protein [Syntrophales bacterium]
MPHVIVKLYPGRGEEQKRKLAEAIAANVVEILSCDMSAVSVAFEEVSSEDWAESVYKPDILDKEEKLYIRPGYSLPAKE